MGTELLYPHENYKPRGRDTPIFPQAHQVSWAWYFVILTSTSSLIGAVLGYPHEHLKHHGRYTSVTPRAPQASWVWYFNTPMSTSSDAVLGIITSTSFDTHEQITDLSSKPISRFGLLMTLVLGLLMYLIGAVLHGVAHHDYDPLMIVSSLIPQYSMIFSSL